MINNDVRELLDRVCSVLSRHNVDYMLVGGVAVGFYGYQRLSTITLYRPAVKLDLDFWYNPTLANFSNLIAALADLDVDTSALAEIVFDPSKTFLKIPHGNFHTDFLCKMEGLDSYNNCKRRASKIILDHNEVLVIGLEDLLKNKKAIGRPGDIDDVNNLTGGF